MYAQIEKELLAILFGCENIHQYIYARSAIVETDHKPLIAIMQKPLHDASPRIQRMQNDKHDNHLNYKWITILADYR